jgi:hypothetical protein
MKIFKTDFFENSLIKDKSIENTMHKIFPKICTGCRVSAAKIYLYHSTEIAKARPHSVEWQTDSSVQKQWFMDNLSKYQNLTIVCQNLTGMTYLQFFLP